MSAFRNIDISPTSSIKQGNRIVHPIYARFVVKDSGPSKSGEQPSTNGQSVEAKGWDSNPSDSRCGLPKTSDAGSYLDEEKNSAQVSSSAVKDNITEKNKKSSIEQKRFYQRKLTGFSPIRLLPVGKLFKLLRPPLQRRNSCPVISISELEAEAKFHQSVVRNTDVANAETQLPTASNEGQRTCRLTKWTSHEELERQEKLLRNENIKSNTYLKKKKSPEAPVAVDPGNEIHSTSSPDDFFQDCELQNGEPYSPLIEKTVIIVSENTAVIPTKSCDPLDSKESKQLQKININGISISMSSRASLSENSCKTPSFDPVSSVNSSSQKLEENNNFREHSPSLPQDIANSNSSQVQHIPQVPHGNSGNFDNHLNPHDCIPHKFKNQKNNDTSENSSSVANNEYIKRDSQLAQTPEIISITPSKINNILSTCDSKTPRFSTFKGDFKSNAIDPIQNNDSKSRNLFSNKNEWDSSNRNHFDNFTLLSPNNQQNTLKAQSTGNRKIYLPDNGTENTTKDDLNYEASPDTNKLNISSELKRFFENVTADQKLENGIKHCDIPIHSPNDKIDSINTNGYLEGKLPQPQLISITCTKTITATNRYQRSSNNPDLINGVNSDPESLNFGENGQNTSVHEIQSADITECYNVKLDAPEEVIVAGFHDFCHTMLSLEETFESQGTGSMKRRKFKTKRDPSKVENNCAVDEANKTFSNGPGNNLTPSSERCTSCDQNMKDPYVQRKPVEVISNKLLDDIQNSKSFEKMNIKDPDVIDAITALDNSLQEASEDPIFVEKDILEAECGISIPQMENCKMDKRPSNVPKEDKIQCDNLIEEVLLEDASRRILNAYKRVAPPPPPKRELKISNSSSPKDHLHKPLMCPSEIKQSNRPPNGTVQKADTFITPEQVQKIRSFDKAANDSSEKNIILNDLPGSISSEVAIANLAQDVAWNRSSPCSVDSGTSSHNQGYFVVVAIDFGTTYSGYAFSLTRDPDNIHMMKKWDGGDPGVCNQKSPTTLLLAPDGTFHSFGFFARDYFHDLEADDAKEWLYFEKFKMSLHNTEHLSLDTEIAAANGKKMPALTIFAHALRYFKEHALQELSDQSATKILNEDVRWVVTVPAIWKQPAKQFMRAAAYQAGIASPEYPEQLLIALEPEAASIYCRKMRLHQLVPEDTQYQKSFHWQKERDTELDTDSLSDKDRSFSTNTFQGEGSFTIGTQYMVVDCGGGTVDITVHELLNKQGALKELQTASGGPYGSIGVDLEFENFLCEIFGNDFMQQFKSTRPTGYIDLMTAFEARKRNASPYKNNSLNISLPFSFIEYYKKYRGFTVESAIKKFSHKSIKWSQGMLRLEPSAMEALFQKTIKQIRKHIEDIICQKGLCIEYIFLVGGFAESLILQKEIKEAFSSKLKVVIPQGVSLAILKGAVLFGLDPTTVNIRRLRMTYGVGVLNQFIHGVHPREKLVIKNGKQWCADVFDKFAVNNQSVGVGDVVVRRYTPAKAGQSCSVIHIYCSEKDNAYFITDPGVKRCATLILDLSDSRYIQSREIQTRMMFGDTEIKVSALDVTTGKCVKAEIDFLNH